MPDTQWPRWVVFETARPTAPHKVAGSVHAPDAELALLNARDVFVRRPEVISLWMVREEHITAKTAEELAAQPGWAADLPDSDAAPQRYLVFQKLGHKATHSHVGEVEAPTAQHALKAALETFPGKGRRQPVVWWVIPNEHVVRSTEEDIAFMFEIAKSKSPIRDQGYFLTQTRLRKAKDAQEEAPS
jgi:ring-1,2-phenylacetyl-CoA epoxidase subunit PaaB